MTSLRTMRNTVCVVGLVVGLAGCATHHRVAANQPQFSLPSSCIKSLVLTDCSTNPLTKTLEHCKHVEVEYVRGCEILRTGGH